MMNIKYFCKLRTLIGGFNPRYMVSVQRKFPLRSPSVLWAEGIMPKLDVEHHVYEEVKSEQEESPLINVLLSANVPGLGSIGNIVSVHRNRFWRYLYINGLAELPSEERIQELKAKHKDKITVLCGESYKLQQLLNGMTLYIPMNPVKNWTLNRTHVKVAFRKYGIMLDEDSIILPTKSIERKNANTPFKVNVIIENIVNVTVSCQIFLYQKLDQTTCTQPPTNVFKKLKVEDWSSDFPATDVHSPF